MEPLRALSLAGFILVIAGLFLMMAQFIWPDHFLSAVKNFEGFGMKLQTNQVGFGVIVVGAGLLIAATWGAKKRRQNSN